MTKCKEYLDPDNSYELITADAGINSYSSWIEVPEGAEIAIHFEKGNRFYFWKDGGLTGWHDKKLNSDGYKWMDCKDNLLLTASDFLKEWDDCSKVVWQRSETEKVEGGKSAGLKYDSDKPRYSLLPKGAVNSVVSVLEFGAKKYEADNWQKVDNAKERYYNAAMRHIDLWWNGEKCDPETSIHHLAHAATNLFFLMWFDEK